ncbi:MAG: hydroxyisourate hydrolase [Pseudomonadota bacterium]
MGKLTTHILDTSAGTPGRGIAFRLYRGEGVAREPIGDFVSNDDGRCDTPLLEGDGFAAGVYELEFEVGEYFRGAGAVDTKPAFLETVTLRFAISDDSHYHVPLLVSPWSYSTYRGS